MKFYALTDIGKRRELNEDSYYIPAAGENYCVVADGMGGHNAGEVASAMAVNAFHEVLQYCGAVTAECMVRAVSRANSRIYEYASKNASCRGMGTTVTGLAANGNKIFFAHVGDSCGYQIRGNRIKKITHDHSVVQEMVDEGKITPLEARNSTYRNYITRAVGTHADVDVDVYTATANKGDVFLICSDGLTNHVTDEEIAEVTASDLAWEEKLNRLIGLALEDGGSDNITAVYAVFTEDNK